MASGKISSSASGPKRKWEFGVGKKANVSSGIMDPGNVLRKMFENQDGDLEMVALDGQVYKFHRIVLSEQVDRFRTIFGDPRTKEHVKKQVVVPPELEMSGPAAEAFLRYIYYEDTTPLYSRFKITCALIRAGKYYDIPGLVDAAIHPLYENRIVDKSLSWFNFPDLWKLYAFVSLWEESHPLKQKLIKHLRAIIKEYCDIFSLADFLKLTPTLPATVLNDLTEALVRVQSSSPSSDRTPVSFKKILSPASLLRRLFENQTSDWKLVGSNGQGCKFHEAVLKEQVARFRTIFAHPETSECAQKLIVIPPEVGLAWSAVYAFLGYIYYQDKFLMCYSFSMTSSLIRAGHYYDISKMVDAATDVLRQKGIIDKNLEWFNFQDLWALYQQVWLWEEGHPSKKRLMENLYTIIKEVCKDKATLKTSSNTPGGDEPLINLIGKLVQDQTSPPAAIAQGVSTPTTPRDPRTFGRGRGVQRSSKR